MLNGKGKKITNDVVEEGEFKDGELHGKGTWVRLGSYEMEGNWIEACLQGQGKVSCRDYVEEGNFVVFDPPIAGWWKFVLHGKGKITFPDGTFLEGYFKEGAINGKRTLPSGEIIEGNIRHGKLVEGKEIWPNGNVRQGKFDGHKLIEGEFFEKSTGHRTVYRADGKCLEYYPDGRVLDKNSDYFI